MRRHPFRGLFAGLFAGVGAAIMLVVAGVVALSTITPFICIGAGIVAGVLWAMFGPARSRRGTPSPPPGEEAAPPSPVEPPAPGETPVEEEKPAAAPEEQGPTAQEPEEHGAPTPPSETTVEGWAPTHAAPPEGLVTYAGAEDGGEPNNRLDPGLAVEVMERQGDWAHIRCSNGWTAWVDGRELRDLGSGS